MEGPKSPHETGPRGERPALTSHLSNSLPTTPHQRPRNRTSLSRSPSIGRSALNSSPRSSHSDSYHSLPPLRRTGGGCKYETGMARARRRMPYSMGSDKLAPDPEPPQPQINPQEAERLSGDMRELYDRLQPSTESEQRRKRLMEKLETLFNQKWPGRDIRVHVFGSSGNNLGTTDSDVDICITTSWTELEHVCALAELLASSGMERVVCVSSAKVPIVKCWDPELQLACDMNVNNTVALENTELIRAYVSLDERVRPLAMIIKHWTKRRILNDAALGGTLSSYTWICMIINFLQTRQPPVLPSLQTARSLPPRMLGGFNVAFDKDLKFYSAIGEKNKESLAQLLFHFFRYYGYELDFEERVMSVRLGTTSSKKQKGWHQMQDNRLCVEEPFNVSRNLGNTADDTSMHGIHQEIRRAFKCLAAGNLQECCEQYIPPPEETRPSEFIKPAVSRPVITQAPVQTNKTSKNSTRAGKHGNHFNRNASASGRHASNQSTRGSSYLRNLPFQMTPQELQLQAQHQQHLLHDRLFQQYQYLQAQEQELRMQLHQQALMQGRLPSTASYPHIAFPSYTTPDDSYDEEASSRASSVSRASMSAPIHQQRFAYPSPYLTSVFPTQGVITNPSSPHFTTVVPVAQRHPRRSSVTQSSAGGSLRAHSQPPRSFPLRMPSRFLQPSAEAAISLPGPDSSADISMRSVREGRTTSTSAPPSSFSQLQHRPAEYIGYYVGQSPLLAPHATSAGASPIASHIGLAIQNGGLSPQSISQVPRGPFASTRLPADASPTDTPPGPTVRGRKPRSKPKPQRTDDTLTHVPNLPQLSTCNIDGLPAPVTKGRGTEDTPDQVEGMTFSATTSEDLTFDTPSSSDTRSQAGQDSNVGELEPNLSSLVLDKMDPNAGKAINHMAASIPSRSTTRAAASTKQTAPLVALGSLSMPNEKDDPSMTGCERSEKLNRGDTAVSMLQHSSTSQGTEEWSRSPNPQRSGSPKSFRPKSSRSSSHTSLDKLTVSPAQHALSEVLTLSTKPNGQPSATISTALAKLGPQTNGWQTQKKKKKPKKAANTDQDDDSPNLAGGETVPVDDAMRKGG